MMQRLMALKNLKNQKNLKKFNQSTEKTSTRQIGNSGEDKAADFLSAQGYQIVERNWRTRRGEIDIIAYKDDILVFAEVKTLPSGDPEVLARQLDGRKQKRNLWWLKKYN